MDWTAFFIHLVTNSGAALKDLEAAVAVVKAAQDVPSEIEEGLKGAAKVLADLVA